MVTYPTDAVFDLQNSFSVVGSVTYSSTASETTFNLATPANFIGEVFAISDGITQATTSYYLSNNNSTINFYAAPNSSNLTLKTISIPSRFQKVRDIDATYVVTYSNSAAVAVNGNSYIINGEQTSWSLPVGASVSSKGPIFVYVNGVAQSTDSYTFPSATLDTQGIDIDPAIPGLANAVLEIKTINNQVVFTDRCNSMADKYPDKGFQESKQFDVSTFESQAGYEKRRLLSRRAKRDYTLTYTAISGVEKQALENFYNERSGTFEDFDFDLTHINQIGTVRVRFDNDLQYQHLGSRGTALKDQYYKVQIKLKEVYG